MVPTIQERFQQSPHKFFYIAAVFYCVLWMLLPFLLQPNLRPDSVEKFFVGKEWLVSTAKHPTLTSAIIETAYFLTGHTPECTYLVTGIALFVMLWSIWKVSNLFLPPPLALLATFASCNYRYLNIGSTFFHESIAVLPFWTLTVLLFYHALKSEKYRYWIAAGVTCGGGLLCKYPMILLAAACFLFVLIFKETRKQSGKLCLTAFIAILIVLPHFCWNYQHGFPTLDYLANKGKMANPHIADHVVSPLLFLGSQLILLLPVWLSICPVFRRAKSINQSIKQASKQARRNHGSISFWDLSFLCRYCSKLPNAFFPVIGCEPVWELIFGCLSLRACSIICR